VGESGERERWAREEKLARTVGEIIEKSENEIRETAKAERRL
jgi:hypothetical protein